MVARPGGGEKGRKYRGFGTPRLVFSGPGDPV